MASADEDRTLARLRALRADLIDPTIAGQNGRVFKRTGDGALVEFRSVVEAVRCAITIQNAMIERNVGMPDRSAHRVPDRHSSRRRRRGERRRPDGRRRQHRRAIGRHRRTRRDLPFRGRLSAGERPARYGGHRSRADAAEEHRRPIRAYSLQVGVPAQAEAGDAVKAARAEEAIDAGSARRRDRRSANRDRRRRMVLPRREPLAPVVATMRPPAARFPSSCCRSPICPAIRGRTTSSTP